MVPATDTSFYAVRRRLAATLRDAAPADVPRPLETQYRGPQDAPSVREAEVIEGARLLSRAVTGAPEARFDAFLDGAQLTLIARWFDSVPVVFGTASAAVRVRRERRLTTWRSPVVRHALYAPLALLSREHQAAIAGAGVAVVDTTDGRKPESLHPLALQELAYQAVLAERERVERQLARAWCEAEHGLLFIDGGIAGDELVANAPHAVGVVKSHQTIYSNSTDIGVITSLGAGERSSVFRIDGAAFRVPRSASQSVASWYLRTADSTGRDPFWGLVRVEVALPAGKRAAIAKRADDVSRWILAERLPLALPDPRWDRMAYGIRDTEEFLRAVQ